MGIQKRMLNIIDKIVRFEVVSAHCDYPCGIYDPYMAQYDVHTVIRMVDMINSMELPTQSNKSEVIEFQHNLSRSTSIKEDFAERCKHELRILWGDYFKPDHIKEYPNLHNLFFTAMHQASKCRQTTDIKEAEQLLETVLQISEIFWNSKGIKSRRVTAPYPTKRQMVLPEL